MLLQLNTSPEYPPEYALTLLKISVLAPWIRLDFRVPPQARGTFPEMMVSLISENTSAIHSQRMCV